MSLSRYFLYGVFEHFKAKKKKQMDDELRCNLNGLKINAGIEGGWNDLEHDAQGHHNNGLNALFQTMIIQIQATE